MLELNLVASRDAKARARTCVRVGGGLYTRYTAHVCIEQTLVVYSMFSLVTSLLVIRGLKKECDYGYPIDNKRVGVILYFENING